MSKICPECGREFENRSVRCPICNCDLEEFIVRGQSGQRPTGQRPQAQQARGQNVQTRQPQAQFRTRAQSAQQQKSNYSPTKKDGPSGMSITALVFSLLGCFSIVGLVLGIVDLCVNKHRKKVCSVLALVFSGLWIVGIAAFFGGSDTPKTPSVSYNPDSYTQSQSGGNSSGNTTQNTIANNNASNSDSAKTVGDTVTGNEWKITLESAKVYDEIADEYYSDVPKDGKKYLVLFFEVENISDKDSFFNYYYLESYLDGYGTTSVLTINKPEGYDDLTGDVASGKKMKGCLKYEVNSDWEELEVSYKEWVGNSDKIATFVVTPDKAQ